MKINTAVIRLHDGQLCMDLSTDEGDGYIDAAALKPAVLAICAPINGDIPAEPFVIVARPGDGTSEFEVQGTQEPVLLELARMWATGEIDGEGPVKVPGFDVIDAAQWEFDGNRLFRAV